MPASLTSTTAAPALSRRAAAARAAFRRAHTATPAGARCRATAAAAEYGACPRPRSHRRCAGLPVPAGSSARLPIGVATTLQRAAHLGHYSPQIRAAQGCARVTKRILHATRGGPSTDDPCTPAGLVCCPGTGLGAAVVRALTERAGPPPSLDRAEALEQAGRRACERRKSRECLAAHSGSDRNDYSLHAARNYLTGIVPRMRRVLTLLLEATLSAEQAHRARAAECDSSRSRAASARTHASSPPFPSARGRGPRRALARRSSAARRSCRGGAHRRRTRSA